MRTIYLPSGRPVPVWGQGPGAWEKISRNDQLRLQLHLGLDFGMPLIDTAEMYGEGGRKKS